MRLRILIVQPEVFVHLINGMHKCENRNETADYDLHKIRKCHQKTNNDKSRCSSLLDGRSMPKLATLHLGKHSACHQTSLSVTLVTSHPTSDKYAITSGTCPPPNFMT